MIGVGSFMMDAVDIFHAACVERRDISAGIIGRASGFVSIVIRRATSKLLSAFSNSMKYRILHLYLGRCQLDTRGGIRCLGRAKEPTSLLQRIYV